MKRRNFINSVTLLSGLSAMPSLAFAASSLSNGAVNKAPLKKGLGFGMIREELPLVDKFKLVKDLGFDGIEFNSPVDIPVSEMLEAKSKTGIVIPSVVNKDHWSKPLSDPDPQVRQACIKSVAQSLQDVKELGGDTVLVVPGVVNEKVSYEQAYNTSLESIRQIIPYAEKTGMHIGIENVWTNFLLSPVEAKRFVDDINHPLVGWYFDIGNVLRYGWPEHWIKTLNSRILKLHIKEFSRELMNNKGLRHGFDVALLEGDNNWPVVMKAVSEINYKGGWITAEVDGGDRNHLQKISRQMDVILSYLP
ncbi:MAG: sugar phosphate isomerase/epimerase [Tannerellaceae bacterium]|jgi:hexulose-6-phosphate isomerase|nr:sugar phosphate isomerase/epimerase [Tannerellaceae bacterium]